MRGLLALAAACGFAALAAPASGQTSATLPVTCNPLVPGDCTRATPVVNPDGTAIGSGGGGATPTGSAGSPNPAVVSVQGVSGGTPQNVQASSLPLPTGAATAANQPAVATNGATVPTTGTLVMGSDGTNARTLSVTTGGALQTQTNGNAANAGTDSGNPVKIGGFASSTPPTAVTTGQRVNAWYTLTGANNSTARGTDTLATAQVSVTTSATLVAAARTGRARIILTLGAANDCFVGNTGVTATTGFRIKGVDGANFTLDTSAAVWAVCAVTTTVSYVEQF